MTDDISIGFKHLRNIVYLFLFRRAMKRMLAVKPLNYRADKNKE